MFRSTRVPPASLNLRNLFNLSRRRRRLYWWRLNVSNSTVTPFLLPSFLPIHHAPRGRSVARRQPHAHARPTIRPDDQGGRWARWDDTAALTFAHGRGGGGGGGTICCSNLGQVDGAPPCVNRWRRRARRGAKQDPPHIFSESHGRGRRSRAPRRGGHDRRGGDCLRVSPAAPRPGAQGPEEEGR